MMALHTPGPWHFLVYLNERDEKLPPHIVGLVDNYAPGCTPSEANRMAVKLCHAARDKAYQP